MFRIFFRCAPALDVVVPNHEELNLITLSCSRQRKARAIMIYDTNIKLTLLWILKLQDISCVNAYSLSLFHSVNILFSLPAERQTAQNM